MRKTLEERFWAKVDKNGPVPEHCPELGPCWVWTASVSTKGYGQIRDEGILRQAHRVSWQMHYGAVQNGLFVLHRCDRPACCNPGHLFLGSNGDNQKDAAAKGRHNMQVHPECHPSRKHPECLARGSGNGANTHPERRPAGERHGCAKLSSADVNAIRCLGGGTRSTSSIAEEYGVSHKTIRLILGGETWRCLLPPTATSPASSS